jgi:hypothetical protein
MRALMVDIAASPEFIQTIIGKSRLPPGTPDLIEYWKASATARKEAH